MFGMTPLERAIAVTGSVAVLAERIGVSRQAIYLWKRIPAERVMDVERATGISHKELRPDLFGRRRREAHT